MSLVNDALKRAKEAHEKQTPRPAPGAPLHAAPPPGNSKLWLIALAAFILATALAIGGVIYLKKHGQPGGATSLNFSFAKLFSKSKTEPETKPIIIIGNVTNPLDHPTPAAPAAPAPKPAPVAAVPKPAVQPTPAPTPTNIIVVDNSRPIKVTPAIIAAATAPAILPPENIKLQGILYSATHPAAIINGRTVFTGDRISGIAITEIAPDRVTILYSNQPVTLKLP